MNRRENVDFGIVDPISSIHMPLYAHISGVMLNSMFHLVLQALATALELLIGWDINLTCDQNNAFFSNTMFKL